MYAYARFMKDLLTKKRKYIEEETIEVHGNCSAIIQKLLPPKFKLLGKFHYSLYNWEFGYWESID